jgi:hypothetical protein
VAERRVRWAANVTIQDLGSIGELIAAVATVATLLYLAVQIRQSVAATRASVAHGQNQMQMSFSLELGRDADLNRLFFDGLADPDVLDERELRRFGSILSSQLGNSEAIWRHYREGWLTSETWEGQLSYLRWYTQQPGFASYWQVWKSVVSADFRQLIENEIANPSTISLEPRE